MKLISTLLLAILLLPGCANYFQHDAARFGIPGPSEESPYRAKAEEFVTYAQAGDVEKMLAITSKLTHATQTDSVRSLYAQQVVPQFAGRTVIWNPQSKGDIDEQNNAGLMFTGTLQGKKTLIFDIVVMKEDGKLVVINIRKHHWYNR